MTSPLAPHSVIQRAVFPAHHTDELLSLYADESEKNSIEFLGAHSASIRRGRQVSFATYFNGFPASYWQRWTRVQSVNAHLVTSGSGTATIMRSDENGVAYEVETRTLHGADLSTSFTLPLTAFAEGGWYWFDLGADEDLLISELVWTVDEPAVRDGKISLGITTFNKPDYCVNTLNALAANADVMAEIDRIFLVDQGSDEVSSQPGYSEVAEALGHQLQIVRQSNLGGSGGFSRAMLETLGREDSEFVMLLDDDVEIEPESFLRAASFARYCVSPTIVGGHMLDLGKRSVLHAFAEVVDTNTFMWGPADRSHERHDFDTRSLRDTPWLHRRQDGDYNGWWMCLIPTQVIREIGLSLPLFIKWDDAEYGLRAQAAGFPTVSLPGAALWHVSWGSKDDTIDWQAYFHARNRLVVALLHSENSGARVLSEYRKLDIKHLLSFQYYPASLRNQAMRDVLAGPQTLHEVMPHILHDLRAQAADFAEMHKYTAETSPRSRDGRGSYSQSSTAPASSLGLAFFTVKAIARHWLWSTPADLRNRPQIELGKRDATWWRIPLLDSVLVDTADGNAASWYVRDRATFRSLLVESFKLNRQLAKQWKVLQKEYRDHATDLASVESWSHTLQR